ncbi:FkbM family methyltransferase [Paraburkholderia atlantica]|uniref:FkbM family methyltransferase n=1 Tax=Paraburkholderia atlantica TaxID=2654982 RepID=UPI003D2562B7
MTITSYAQNFEDVMLWRALAGVERGLYIDVGAQDPIVDSVSLLFHEHGWRGIHVEPTPHYAELLRKQRPGDTIIQAAIANEHAVLKFFEISGTGISTADTAIAAQHRERGFDTHEIVVPAIPLSSVLETVADAEVHWLKIDVEGFEAQVLSSWGAAKVRPWIVVVESVLPLCRIETHEKWETVLLSYGYSLAYMDGVNRFYVSDAHPEIKTAFEIPPNIFDRFALNGTASATFHWRIEERCTEKVNAALAEVEEVKQAASREIDRLNEQEQAVSRKLVAEQAEVRRVLADAANREKVLAEQTGLARQQLENVLRTLAQREQEVGVQLCTIHQQMAAEKAEQAGRIEAQNEKHEELVRLLERRHADREDSLRDRLDALTIELHRLQKEESQLGREHAEQIRQSRQALEIELRRQLEREQEMIAQTLRNRQEFALEKAEQAKRYTEEIGILKREQLERTEAYSRELQTAHQIIQDITLNCANLQRQFEEQLSAGAEVGQHFRQAVASLESELAAMRNAISWRLTAPLRRVGRLFTRPSDSKTGFNHVNAAKSVVEGASSGPTNLHEASPHAAASNSSLCEAFSMKSDHISVMTPLPRSSASENFKALLQYQDYQFVESAYLTLLKRNPDSDGGSYYLGRLRSGVPKIQILGQLYASEEARMMGVQLPGLRRAMKWHKLGQLPLFGSVVRLFVSVERNTQFENRLRAMEQQIFLLGQLSESRFSQLDRAMDGLKMAIDSGMRTGVPAQVQQFSREAPQANAVAHVKPQSRSILTEAIVLEAGAPDEVIEQLACALANSQEAQRLAVN